MLAEYLCGRGVTVLYGLGDHTVLWWGFFFVFFRPAQSARAAIWRRLHGCLWESGVPLVL